MTYVAMLRGVNVSGQKPIAMERLRLLFDALGYRDVRTYVQSGNVVFEATKGSPAGLAGQIGAAILREFGFSVSVLVKTSKEMADVVKNNPFVNEQTIDPSKLHVTFLLTPATASALRNLTTLDAKPDRFHAAGRVIYLYCPNGYGRTKLSNNALEKRLSVGATTRNWRTVTKLLEMSGASRP